MIVVQTVIFLNVIKSVVLFHSCDVQMETLGMRPALARLCMKHRNVHLTNVQELHHAEVGDYLVWPNKHSSIVPEMCRNSKHPNSNS